MTELPVPARPDDSVRRTPVRDAAVAYAMSIGLFVVAHVITAYYWHTLGPAAPTIYLGAVVISALYCGYGPGLVLTAMASADLAYTFMPPYNSFTVDFQDALLVVTFFAVALVTSSLQARRRGAEASLRRAHDELERRVSDRTAELATSQDRLRQLVRDVLTIAEREQQRIGHDLHDGLGQELTGISMLSSALAGELHTAGSASAGHAERLAELVQDSIGHARDLARGLFPVDLEDAGLAASLQRLAESVSRLPNIVCSFATDLPPHESLAPGSRIDLEIATHLYRVAQEAINNALRHGGAGRIDVTLHSNDGRLRLSVTDDGGGFAIDDAPSGMGLRLMHYRAKTIRATLDIRPGTTGGTCVTCELDPTAGADHA